MPSNEVRRAPAKQRERRLSVALDATHQLLGEGRGRDIIRAVRDRRPNACDPLDPDIGECHRSMDRDGQAPSGEGSGIRGRAIAGI